MADLDPRTCNGKGCLVRTEGQILRRYQVDQCPLHGAAPDLLSVLKTIIAEVERRDHIELNHGHGLVMAVRAAIAKAEGR